MWEMSRECINIVMQIVKVCLFYIAVFDGKIKKNWRSYLEVGIFLVVGSVAANVFIKPDEHIYWRIAAVFIGVMYLFHNSFIKKMGICFFLYVLVDLLDGIFLIITSYLGGNHGKVDYNHVTLEIILFLGIDICLAGLWMKIKKAMPSIRLTRKESMMICLVGGCVAVALECTQILLSGEYDNRVKNLAGMSMIIVCVILCITCVMQLILRSENTYYQKIIEQEKKYAKMQEKYYKEIYKKNKKPFT